MTTLKEAPLIEAIFEIRWGKYILQPNKPIEFHFSPEDTDFFPGQFRSEANSNGFAVIEHVNPDYPLLPHIVKYRFRRKENTWPCYQVGLGVMTVNQLNEGYDWGVFKKDILTGLEMLEKGHPFGLEKLPSSGIELRYHDGFFLEEGETPSQFLNNKLNIVFSPHEGFLKSPNLEKNLQGNKLTFSVKSIRPKGLVIINLVESLINGRPGFVMETIVRSPDESKPIYQKDVLSEWLDEAHDLQKHAFNTLIEPTYFKSFK